MTEATTTGDVLMPGTRLDELEIERVPGAGGFGVTYLARDVSLDAWRAVKEYLPQGWGTRRGDGTVEEGHGRGPRRGIGHSNRGLRAGVGRAAAVGRGGGGRTGGCGAGRGADLLWAWACPRRELGYPRDCA